MRQALFLCFLAVGLAGFIGINLYLDHQVELKAMSEKELATFKSERETARLNFLGEYLLNLKKPDEVVAYRIESDWPNWPKEPVAYLFPTSPRLLGKYPIIQGRFLEEQKQIENLVSRFTTNKTFTNKAQLCSRAQPSVAYEFVRGDKKLVVTMCFKCNRMTFFKDSGESFEQTFRPVRDEMVPLVKQTIGLLVH